MPKANFVHKQYPDIQHFYYNIILICTPSTVTPESVSVVDGKICMEFPSEDRGFFFRFRVE